MEIYFFPFLLLTGSGYIHKNVSVWIFCLFFFFLDFFISFFLRSCWIPPYKLYGRRGNFAPFTFFFSRREVMYVFFISSFFILCAIFFIFFYLINNNNNN